MKNLLHITEKRLPQKCRTCASVFERPEDVYCLVCVHLPDTSGFPRWSDCWMPMEAGQIEQAVTLGLFSPQDAMNLRLEIANRRLRGTEINRVDLDEIPF